MASPPLESIVSFTRAWHNDTYPAIAPLPEEDTSSSPAVARASERRRPLRLRRRVPTLFLLLAAASIVSWPAAQAGCEASPPTQVVTQTGDVTDCASITAALSAVVAKMGHAIDVFLNNAGMLPVEGPVVGCPEAVVRRDTEINFLGTLNALQAFTPLAAAGAKLVHTGSSIAHWAPLAEVPGVWSYAATKAAAQKLIDYYAYENPQIHVASFTPGIVGTEINPNIPVEPGKVKLPGHFAVWLVSDEAAFLRNKFVWANWDVAELQRRTEEIRNSSLLTTLLSGVGM